MILDKNAFGLRGYIIKKAFKANFKLKNQEFIKNLLLNTLSENNDISIYIHFPFCKSLCPSCPYVRYLYDNNLV
jgi:coproporphyrinogen III oxidase-like Fe-S oxidoreductase